MGTDANQAHVNKYQASIGKAASAGPLEFQQWFCKSSSLEETRIRGYWDFAVHILTPAVVAEISRPQEKTVLEIGYGGGRILNAACAFFGHAIGVDIHNETQTFIEHKNVTLLVGDGQTLPVKDASVDFVYSFIVFLHLQSFDAFRSYLSETYRVLKSGGVAQLYYGLKPTAIEESHCFHEAPANNASLIIGAQTAQEESRKAGFDVIDTGKSYKNMPDGFPNVIGQQGFVTLKKR